MTQLPYCTNHSKLVFAGLSRSLYIYICIYSFDTYNLLMGMVGKGKGFFYEVH